MKCIQSRKRTCGEWNNETGSVYGPSEFPHIVIPVPVGDLKMRFLVISVTTLVVVLCCVSIFTVLADPEIFALERKHMQAKKVR